MKIYLLFFYSLTTAFLCGQNTKVFHPEQIPLFIVYIQGVKENNEITSGSGLFLGDGECFYILTAGHVVRSMVKDEMIALDFDGKGVKRKVMLREIRNSEWVFHEDADLAIIRLSKTISLQLKQSQRFFPINQIHADSIPFSRMNEVYVYGFPFFLNENATHFSASTLRTFFSSGFLDLKREDTEENILNTFQILQAPSMEGYSGGPVFNIDGHYSQGISITGSNTQLLGIVHGTLKDSTGGKAAAVIPSFYIIDLLKKMKCK